EQVNPLQEGSRCLAGQRAAEARPSRADSCWIGSYPCHPGSLALHWPESNLVAPRRRQAGKGWDSAVILGRVLEFRPNAEGSKPRSRAQIVDGLVLLDRNSGCLPPSQRG